MDLAKRIESARLTFFLAALIGCSPGSEPSVGLSVSEVDSAGIALVTITGEVTDLPLWTLPSEPDALISGEAPPYLGSIGEVEFLSDGSFLVEDNQTDELRLFDSRGELRRLVGGAGEGPGEFRNITELTVTPGDTAYTYDRRLDRISVFDHAGDLIRTIGLTRENGGYGSLAMDVWAFDSQRLVLYRLSPYDTTDASPLPRRDQRDVVLFALDGGGEVIAEPVRFPGRYSVEFEDGDTGVPFANRPAIDVGSGRLVHTSGSDYELTVSTPDLRPELVIRWRGWQKPLTAAEVQEVRESFEAGLNEEFRTQLPDVARSLVEASFSPNILPEMRPVIGGTFVDETGRIWVSKFRPTTNPWQQGNSWHVLDANGHPLARVSLPSQAQLAAVQQDRVALVMRDALDVEHLAIFRIVDAEASR